MDGEAVRGKIRAKLANGNLQRRYDLTTMQVADSGNGKPCDACDEPIKTSDRAPVSYATNKGTRHQFHADCLKLWDELWNEPIKRK